MKAVRGIPQPLHEGCAASSPPAPVAQAQPRDRPIHTRHQYQQSTIYNTRVRSRERDLMSQILTQTRTLIPDPEPKPWPEPCLRLNCGAGIKSLGTQPVEMQDVNFTKASIGTNKNTGIVSLIIQLA